MEIIESDRSLELKQKKIDSLLMSSIERSTNADLADTYHDLALHWYHPNWNNTGFEKYLLDAIAHTKKAVALKSRLDSIDSISLKRSLFNLGFLQKLNDDLYASLNSHLRLVQLGGKDNRVKAAHQELGDTYRTIGDYQKAIDHLEMALTIAQNDTQNYAAKATAHIAMAENYSSMGHKEYADKVTFHLQVADSLIAADSDKNSFIGAQIAMLRGNLLLMLGNYDGAKQHHLKVLEFSNTHVKEFSKSDLKHNLATVHNSIGMSYDKLGETKIALEHLNKALLLNTEFSLPYENLGDLFLNSGEFEKGLLHYQKAIALATNKNLEVKYDDIPSLEDLELSPKKTFLLSHIVIKANGWLKYYHFDNKKEYLVHALETFTLADQLVDLIRFESTEHQSKLYWREQGALLYMKAVEVCYLLNKPKEAFHFMERNKALLLLEDLTNEEAKEIANLPNKAAEREFSLKRAIFLSENSRQVVGDESQEVISRLKETIREDKYRYEQFVDSLNKAYPEYAKFKKKVDVLTFNELKANYLLDEQAVLHYILNDEQGYGLLTTADTTLLFKLENPSKLNWDIEVLIHMLSSGNSDQETFNALAYTLFENLIPEKVYDEIKGKQLTIIPDYTLQRIPFEALVVNKEEPKYLIEEVDIGYAYSMSLLDHTKGREKNSPNDLVAFAPVQFDSMGLPQLYFSENEITGIADVYPGETLMNGRATKANFIENVDQHKIVHLATHADVGDGENPWIAFSDSKMYLKEIYATRNQADMVVLSGCNTSNGELKRGEGVMSLARGFFYSGAKSVVSTLWPVADEAGKDILIGFYKNLDQGCSKSEALQKAKLAYLKTTEEVELKHPYYWAGFIVVGDNAPMVTKSYWYWILLAMGLLVLVFLLVRGKLFKGIQ
ncbi:CHAT domain-containing protein [Pricia sp.]|uniref:CHAT domain-containing protein n=1 Tax=Pricia sp. TaxID=2268138 RepID=UPI0035932B4D